jgi:hypothetical protein
MSANLTTSRTRNLFMTSSAFQRGIVLLPFPLCIPFYIHSAQVVLPLRISTTVATSQHLPVSPPHLEHTRTYSAAASVSKAPASRRVITPKFTLVAGLMKGRWLASAARVLIGYRCFGGTRSTPG